MEKKKTNNLWEKKEIINTLGISKLVYIASILPIPETDILKSHYELTLSSLQKDFYDRPWLERGERVSVTYSSVDLNSGLLMLPIGKNNGLEQEMRFSVRVKGRSVCQIRIKEVAYDHCIAMIVPLLGNPIQLIEENSLDLIHL